PASYLSFAHLPGTYSAGRWERRLGTFFGVPGIPRYLFSSLGVGKVAKIANVFHIRPGARSGASRSAYYTPQWHFVAILWQHRAVARTLGRPGERSSVSRPILIAENPRLPTGGSFPVPGRCDSAAALSPSPPPSPRP